MTLFILLTGIAVVLKHLSVAFEVYSSKETETNQSDFRIIGGRPAKQGEFPYILSMQIYNKHRCGSSLIDLDGVQVALIAAHCVNYILPGSLTLVAGEIALNETSGFEQTRSMTSIVKHPDFVFSDKTGENDIAVVFFDPPFEYSNNVRPISLPEQWQETEGSVVVTGWGRIDVWGSNYYALQAVDIPVLSNSLCQALYQETYKDFILRDHQMCAGYLDEEGKDSCGGDSGGPAKSLDGDYLAGIVSGGHGCGIPSNPGIYVKVSHFVDWITETIRNIAGVENA